MQCNANNVHDDAFVVIFCAEVKKTKQQCFVVQK